MAKRATAAQKKARENFARNVRKVNKVCKTSRDVPACKSKEWKKLKKNKK